MKKALYEVVFKATYTQANGAERTITKSVFSPVFDPETMRHITEGQRIERGTAALKAEQFYNIEYIYTKRTALIFV